MKFVTLRAKRSVRRRNLNESSRAPLESSSRSAAVPQIHTYAELRRQIHDDLRIQHPDWIQPNGESPVCDAYEARLKEVLDSFRRMGSNASVAAAHRVLEQASA